MILSLLLFFLMLQPQAQEQINLDNKIIPKTIEKEVIAALEYYPELYDIPIEFKFKDKIKKSTMQAQPKLSGIFRSKKKRKYVVLISRKIQIDDEDFTMEDIPSQVIIGWIGHELGHIMDYQSRTNFGLIILGLKYVFSKKSIRKVERTADTYAVTQGMGHYILETKNFILDNADISEKYKTRIRRLYISPEEVMELINENETVTEADVQEVEEEA